MIYILKSLKRQRGFSLVEMLISMVIFSIVMGIIYSYLLQTKKDLAESQVELNTADNAQTAINTVRKDLYQIGVGRDAKEGQPQLLRAGMYDIIFVSDLDRKVRNNDRRYGSPDPNYSMSFAPGSPFQPLYFLYNPTIPDDLKYSGWDPSVAYGYRNIGAEIVRYSLDMNDDDRINYRDLEDNISLDPDRSHTYNDQDFWLNKEWWGCVKEGSGYVNQHSGSHPVAFNMRGMFYRASGGVNSSSLGRFKYPNGEYPQPLFTYWGHFYNTITANDNPDDPDWPGEPIELWGDWGGQYPALNQPGSPDNATGARDGVLSQTEINYMYNSNMFSQVNLNYLRTTSGVAGEAEGQDLNGNGITGERQLDQFIRRIGVTITTESDSPNDKRPNLKRSNLTNASNPIYYYYQDYEVSIQVNPKNLAYAGSPEIEMSQMTPTPHPATPTPVPPTNTPDPSLPTNTPMATTTAGPWATATPTSSGSYDPYDGEVVMGTNLDVWVMSIDRDAADAGEICNLLNLNSNYVGGLVLDIEPANLCDSVGYFDEWNDLVIATTAVNGVPNLFYFNHLPNTSLNGFTNRKETVVGYHPLDKISCIEVGNIGDFGMVPEEYDEVLVAYHRANPPSDFHTYIEVFFLNSPCGDLINTGASLPILDIATEKEVKDMVISDFDGDGVGELVVLIDSMTSESIPQIRYYPDLNNIATGWDNYYEWFVDWGVDIQCSNVIAASAIAPGDPIPLQKDLIIIAENGDFRIVKNLVTGIPGSMPFPISESSFLGPLPPFSGFSEVAGAVVYNRETYIGNNYYPVLAITGTTFTGGYQQISHFDISDPINSVQMNACTGAIYPYATPAPPATPSYPIVQPVGLAYAPVENGVNHNRHLIIPSYIDMTNDFAIILTNPCNYTDPSSTDVSCNFELNMIPAGITCLTTTRSTLSDSISYMPSPTPAATPSPTPGA